MKKIKLLTPLLSAAAVAGIVLPMASCACNNGDSYIRESKSFEKEQTIDTVARFIFVLDKDNYKQHDTSVSLTGDDSDKFTVSSFLSNELLVVEVTPKEQPDEGSVTYTLGLSIKVATHKKDVTGLKITVLPSKEEPTVNEHLKYEYDADKEGYYAYCDLENDEQKALWDVTTLCFPETYDDGINGEHPVVGIDQYGFYNCTTIKKLVIPASIKYIDEAAFECLSYEYSSTISSSLCNGQISIIKFLPNSQLENIDSSVFAGQNKLTNIIIPKSVKSLGSYCFWCNDYYYNQDDETSYYNLSKGSLENITFESNSQLENIGYSCFYGQNKLKSIKIPDNVKAIDYDTFYCHDAWYEIKDNVPTYISEASGSLEKVEFTTNSKLDYIESEAFCGQKALTTFDLPNTVTYIGDEAFACTHYEYNDTELFNVGLGNISTFNIDINNSKLEEICYDAFIGQKELTSINIPQYCTKIGLTRNDDDRGLLVASNIFVLCPKLKTFNVNPNNNDVWTNNDKNILFANSTDEDTETEKYSTLVSYPTAKGDVDFSEINQAKFVGESLFQFNDDITSIKITNDAFEFICPYVTCYNKKLKKVEIGKNIIDIDTWSFDDTIYLDNFVVDSNNTHVQSAGTGTNKPILLLKSDSGTYANKWKMIAFPSATGDIDLTDTAYNAIEVLGKYCFYQSDITSMKLNSSTKQIEAYGFDKCPKMKTIDLNMVEELDRWSLSRCYALEKITVNNSNTVMQTRKNDQILINANTNTLECYLNGAGKDVNFSNDSTLSDIKVIASAAFDPYTLETINLLSLGNIETLQSNCFSSRCFESSTITIPSSMKKIESFVFSGVRSTQGNITEITFNDPKEWRCNGKPIIVNDSTKNASNLVQGGEWCRSGINKA